MPENLSSFSEKELFLSKFSLIRLDLSLAASTNIARPSCILLSVSLNFLTSGRSLETEGVVEVVEGWSHSSLIAGGEEGDSAGEFTLSLLFTFLFFRFVGGSNSNLLLLLLLQK